MRGARAMLAHLGGDLPAAFWWLFAGMLVNALATFVFPFLALFLTSRGISVARAGLVVALYGGGNGAGAGPRDACVPARGPGHRRRRGRSRAPRSRVRPAVLGEQPRGRDRAGVGRRARLARLPDALPRRRRHHAYV